MNCNSGKKSELRDFIFLLQCQIASIGNFFKDASLCFWKSSSASLSHTAAHLPSSLIKAKVRFHITVESSGCATKTALPLQTKALGCAPALLPSPQLWSQLTTRWADLLSTVSRKWSHSFFIIIILLYFILLAHLGLTLENVSSINVREAEWWFCQEQRRSDTGGGRMGAS